MGERSSVVCEKKVESECDGFHLFSSLFFFSSEYVLEWI